MSVTHGGKSREFIWRLNDNIINIRNENGIEHAYVLNEIIEIIKWLKNSFQDEWFPLANNVALMGRKKEKDGLGTAILNLTPKNITHAQGASYLGVVLDEIGIFEWNAKIKGIKWRIIKDINTTDQLIKCITKR